MLVVFPPKFVADTKIIYGYHFVAPLKISISSDQLSNWKNRSKHFCGSPWYPIFKKQILRCIWHSPNSGFNVCSSVGLSSLTRLRVGLWNIGFVIFFGIHSTLYAIRGKTPKPLSTSFSFTKILQDLDSNLRTLNESFLTQTLDCLTQKLNIYCWQSRSIILWFYSTRWPENCLPEEYPPTKSTLVLR